MILDCSKYVGPCRCGREHTLETKKVVVEYHALDKFDQYMDEVGLTGKRAVIYDTNTYNLPTLRHVRADQEIVLNAEGLHSEKGMIEDMMRQLDHPDVIVAVGSGTIMDFGRYPAYHLGIPFVAVPTLASSDGFTANICSIIIDGQKKSIPMQAAALVVCDLNVVSGAPLWLTVSGISDILAKYISLADWKIAHLVSGEYYCPMVADLAQEALTIMRKAADDMAAGGKPDFEAMTMAQMISGLTMQLLNHSRAASGASDSCAAPGARGRSTPDAGGPAGSGTGTCSHTGTYARSDTGSGGCRRNAAGELGGCAGDSGGYLPAAVRRAARLRCQYARRYGADPNRERAVPHAGDPRRQQAAADGSGDAGDRQKMPHRAKKSDQIHHPGGRPAGGVYSKRPQPGRGG